MVGGGSEMRGAGVPIGVGPGVVLRVRWVEVEVGLAMSGYAGVLGPFLPVAPRG